MSGDEDARGLGPGTRGTDPASRGVGQTSEDLLGLIVVLAEDPNDPLPDVEGQPNPTSEQWEEWYRKVDEYHARRGARFGAGPGGQGGQGRGGHGTAARPTPPSPQPVADVATTEPAPIAGAPTGDPSTGYLPSAGAATAGGGTSPTGSPTGHPIVITRPNSAESEVLIGVAEGLGDTGLSFAQGLAIQALTLGTSTGPLLAYQLYQRHRAAGGGWRGTEVAFNETLNPIYQIAEAGIKADEAYEAGDYRGAGRAAGKGLGVAALTVAKVPGSRGSRGIANRISTPGPRTGRATTNRIPTASVPQRASGQGLTGKRTRKKAAEPEEPLGVVDWPAQSNPRLARRAEIEMNKVRAIKQEKGYTQLAAEFEAMSARLRDEKTKYKAVFSGNEIRARVDIGSLRGSRKADSAAANRIAGFPGDKPPPGYEWHHSDKLGIMELVTSEAHRRESQHIGQVAIWEALFDVKYGK